MLDLLVEDQLLRPEVGCHAVILGVAEEVPADLPLVRDQRLLDALVCVQVRHSSLPVVLEPLAVGHLLAFRVSHRCICAKSIVLAEILADLPSHHAIALLRRESAARPLEAAGR